MRSKLILETRKVFLKSLCIECHKTAFDKGFWTEDHVGIKIALMHSELSEALEAARLKDDTLKLPLIMEELADCVIRIFDFAGRHGAELFAMALLEKIEVNKKRPRKHGKLF